MERLELRQATYADETTLVRQLAKAAKLDRNAGERISKTAADIVRELRASGKTGIMEAFLAEYGLSTQEGVALMCLAEAMLRVPDSETVDELIKDKITPHNWAAHIGDSGSILVNASTWGLMLTGQVLDQDSKGIAGVLHGLVRRVGEPVIRKAVGQAMAEMGSQFVLGETIQKAMKRGAGMVDKGYTYSFDMLGEAARTDHDARGYHDAYAQAIKAIGDSALHSDIRENPGISVKLSALHPRYEYGQRETMLPVLSERLLELARQAKAAGIGFNIDAEEADRLDLSLDVIAAVLADPSLKGWDGFGMVIQAFGKRATHVVDWFYDLATGLDRRVMVRLVKGAYWDTEIKRAQVMGLKGYPVFTKKTHTDISYLACARQLLGQKDRIYPQFATHNAHSVAAILEMAGDDKQSFEFQRLHGMGEALHEAVKARANTRCRIYAPVGAHRDLLAYLVRRLLENGANSSFVNQIVNEAISPEEIAQDPIELAQSEGFAGNEHIPSPADVFYPRQNSSGFDLTDPIDLDAIDTGRKPFMAPHRWQATALTNTNGQGDTRLISNPAIAGEVVGEVTEANEDWAKAAVDEAKAAQSGWARMANSERAQILRRTAELFEANSFEIFALLSREAGKTLLDGVAEIREAVDFLRYYADECEKLKADQNPRGIIVCISPWNFPLAIFTGQIAAALAAGNAVIAKPAEQTPLIAHLATGLMRHAGVPPGVIQLLPGDGASVGAALTSDPRIDGVCFTGSTEVAKLIDRQLAKTAPHAMLIAETGGINAMIVDSTALLEQAVRDIIRASFQSAGQRCSALRMLYVQKDVEAELLEMLEGAMDELAIGDPWALRTDIGPVIDQDAHQQITSYCAKMSEAGQIIKQLPAPTGGLFVPPTIVRIAGIEEIEQEIFGPVLHLASFESDKIDQVLAAINAKGYGLTFGLHTRIDSRVQYVLEHIHVGNAYVNRDQIGAVVGSQPFGGHGMSGTGPKAGGPNYLPKFLKPTPTANVSSSTGPTIDAATIIHALDKLDAAAWRQSDHRVTSLRQILRGVAAPAVSASAALDLGPIDLPGPTGESNQFRLMARGRVLCLGPTPETLKAQVVQALAVGNAVLAVAPNASSLLKAFLRSSAPICALDGCIEPEMLETLPIDAVAFDGPLKQLRLALSKRNGAILPLISEVIAPAEYCQERTICIDTTAAGGNVTLLSADDQTSEFDA